MLTALKIVDNTVRVIMGSRPPGAAREKAKDDSEARYINCTLDSTKSSMNTQPLSEHQNAINEFLS